MEFQKFSAKPGQVMKVRFIQFVLCALGVWFLFWAFDLSRTFGLNPGDGGVLRPVFERYLWAIIMLVLGVSAIAGAVAYVSRYVVSLTKLGDRFELVVLGFFQEKREVFPTKDVELIYHEGKMRAWRPNGSMLSVNAPWWEVRVPNRKIPYIIDAK